MNTVLVWLLIVTSTDLNLTGDVKVIAKFASLNQCEHVIKNIPRGGVTVRAACVQASIVN